MENSKRIFKQRAVFSVNHYKHFGIHPMTASMYGYEPKDIVEVKMVISDNQELPDDNNKSVGAMQVDYWGWFDNEKNDFTLVYPKRFLLNMCFPYGMNVSEKSGEGKAYRLEII